MNTTFSLEVQYLATNGPTQPPSPSKTLITEIVDLNYRYINESLFVTLTFTYLLVQGELENEDRQSLERIKDGKEVLKGNGL